MAEQAAPQPQAVGDQSFLSPEERQQMQRYLAFPEEFPRKFGSWIADYIAVNGLEIPASQIRGISQFRPEVATLASAVGIGSTSYVDGGGPTMSDIAKGTYLFLYGFQFANNTGNNEGYGLASPSINGAAAGDGDAVRTGFLLGTDDALSDADKTEGSSMYFKIATLDLEENSITMKYRVTDGALAFTNMYIIAIKLSN
jgi:hypothetical protein